STSASSCAYVSSLIASRSGYRAAARGSQASTCTGGKGACLAMPVTWTPGEGEYEDVRYELSGDGIAKITIDRPEVRNAFRPQTVVELSTAFERAREDPSVGVIILTGEGPLAFCSGGDQRVRGDQGYLADDEAGRSGVGRFHV